jgi:hypothetical protein
MNSSDKYPLYHPTFDPYLERLLVSSGDSIDEDAELVGLDGGWINHCPSNTRKLLMEGLLNMDGEILGSNARLQVLLCELITQALQSFPKDHPLLQCIFRNYTN